MYTSAGAKALKEKLNDSQGKPWLMTSGGCFELVVLDQTVKSVNIKQKHKL
jgi:hypothetical protein